MIKGLCRYESLKDGTIDLADIALMNDALAVQADNETQMRELMEKQNGRR
ncbi:MAG: hypothetical protein ABFC42_09245 [Sulfuricella sp.]